MTTDIDYDHALNLHTLDGARAAFSKLPGGVLPASVLDVGCGTGTWLRAALDQGVTDAFGIDGVPIPAKQLLIPADMFRCLDLTRPVELGRKFDLVLCLEVAEHLDQAHADALLGTLTRHADCVLFSAACPGQPGQHHVNCQWPQWWQQRFNSLGYACDDEIRCKLWDEAAVEPWYRQNIFTARKDLRRASREPRLKAVIHPDMLRLFAEASFLTAIENGSMSVPWYLQIPFRALATKVSRRVNR